MAPPTGPCQATCPQASVSWRGATSQWQSGRASGFFLFFSFFFSLGGTLARWGALPKGKRLGQSPPLLPKRGVASPSQSGQGGLLPRRLGGQDQASWQKSPLWSWPCCPAAVSSLCCISSAMPLLGGTLARWGALPKGKRLGQSPPCLANGAAH